MKTASKISISIILTALLSALVFSGLSYWQSRTVLQDAAFADVSALRDAKTAQIEEFFTGKLNATDSIATNPQIAAALTDLQTAFRKINQGGELVLADESSIVRDYYERRVLPRIAKYTGAPNASYDVYGPKTRAARHLQNIFIVQPPSDRAPRRNTYAEAHAFYHPRLNALVQTHGFSDLFLIDIENGNIVYSAAKNIDFGSDINEGAFKSTALGKVVETTKARPSTHVSDIDLYVPAGSMAAAFTAAPIYADGVVIGIVALQMEASEVSALSASGIKGRADRDVYLVGGDNLMRSNAPFAQENLNAYVRLLQRANIEDAVTAKVKLGKSTILAQSVASGAVSAALRGEKGATLTENYFGQSVASAYAPVTVGENDWVIIAERNAGDIFAPLQPFARRLVIAAAIFLPLLALCAIWLGWRLMRPARRFMESAADLADGNNVHFPEDKTEWGRIGTEMNKYVGQDPWEVSLSAIPPRRERRAQPPVQLIVAGTGETPKTPTEKEDVTAGSDKLIPAEKPKPESQPETKPAPTQDTKSEVKIEAEIKPEPTPKPEPKSKPEPKTQVKPESVTDSEPTRAERRALAKAEKRAKIRAEKEAKVDARIKAANEQREKIEAERLARAEERERADTERLAKIKVEAEVREEARVKAAAEREVKADAEAKARAEKQAALDAERKVKAEARKKAVAEKEAKVEAEIKAKAEIRAKAAAEQQVKIKARQELEAQQRAAAEVERKVKAETARKAAEAIEAKAEARTEVARKIQKAREEAAAKTRPVQKLKRAARSDVSLGSSKPRVATKPKSSASAKPVIMPKPAPKAEAKMSPSNVSKEAPKHKGKKVDAAPEKSDDTPPLTTTNRSRSRLRRRRR